MTYSFDTELAQKLGVNEAIFLQNIVFWLLKNKANGSNYYDGRYWTYNSHKAFKELFPFWTENQIRRILESLFEKCVILKGNYNSSPYNKTKWYALSDKYVYLIGLSSQSDMANLPDVDDENAGCLIGTDIKPDSKQQIINTDSTTKSKAQNKFAPPTPEEISAFMQDRGVDSFTVDDFYLHYLSNGWKVGKVPMKSWKATVLKWHNQNQKPRVK